MKITIDNVHIEKLYVPAVPRGTKDSNAMPLKEHNNILKGWRDENERLSSLNQTLKDLPPDTVTTKYHDELMDAWERKRAKFNERHEALKVRRKELQDANTELSAKLVEDAKDHNNLRDSHQEILLINERLRKTEKTQNERMLEIVAQRDEAWNERDNIKALRSTIKFLEDKVAGYELGFNKEQVEKECRDTADLPPKKVDNKLTAKGKKRQNRRMLTEEEVWQIRRFIKAGRSDVWIERQTQLPSQTTSKIRHGRSYTNVRPEPKGQPVCLRVGWGITRQSHPHLKGKDNE